MTDYPELTVLGSKADFAGLETFPAPQHCTLVTFTTNEFTSFCPVTGQPDFSTVTIEYVPDQVCIESKSLKLYLRSWREKAAFVEELADRIGEDVMKATASGYVTVTVDQGIRGGIRTVATSKRSA